jgi:RNA polymerase sigma factor (sigma-70 family)
VLGSRSQEGEVTRLAEGPDVADDRASVARVDGDFEAFWRANRQQLYGALAVALGDAGLAAEAVDEAMVRAYQRWATVGRYDNPSGWVYRVAVNWARSWIRRARRPPPRPGTLVAEAPALQDETLQAAVRALPVQHRDVIVLRYHLDWPIAWIASALDVPAGTVKSRLHRGLEQLRADLEVTS